MSAVCFRLFLVPNIVPRIVPANAAYERTVFLSRIFTAAVRSQRFSISMNFLDGPRTEPSFVSRVILVKTDC